MMCYIPWRSCATVLLCGLLSGCMLWHTDSEEVRQRDAVQRLGVDGVARLLDRAAVPALSEDDMILVARPEITASLTRLPEKARVDGPRLRNALVRAILQLKHMPQVVGWAPRNEAAALALPLWRLDSQFSAYPAISLSDRQLYPYRLVLTLHRPDRTPRVLTLSGAFDSQALGPQARHDTLFSVE